MLWGQLSLQGPKSCTAKRQRPALHWTGRLGSGSYFLASVGEPKCFFSFYRIHTLHFPDSQ